jgi:hypothetical protein
MTMVSIKENRDTGIIRPLMEANIKHEKKIISNASQSPVTIIARNSPHPYAYRN